MIKERNKDLPIRWMDLVSFDKDWARDKTFEYYTDTDGVSKPRAFDSSGKQVYP